MSSTDEALLIAVLKQVGEVKLDFDLLAQEIGAPTKGAAAKRWSRYQAKLKNGTAVPSSAGNPAKPVGVTKNKGTAGATAPKSAAAKKAPASKGKEGAVKSEGQVEGDGEGEEPVTPVVKKKAAAKPKAKGAAAGKAKSKVFKSEVRIVEDEAEVFQVESDQEMSNGGPVKAGEDAEDAEDDEAGSDGYYYAEGEET